MVHMTGAGHFAPDQIVRVVGHAHLIRLGIADPQFD